MDTMKDHNLIIMGSSGVGKSSLRSAWSCNTKDFSNMGPTETVTFSSETFLNNHIAMRDYGSSKEGLELQHSRATYKNVDGMIFVFNAVQKDQTQDLEYFRKVWNLLATESPTAMVFVFHHRSDLIEGSQTKALCAFGLQLRNAILSSKARELSRIKLLSTSVYHHDSVFFAWSTVCRLLCGIPAGWKERLATFGSGMGFDQVMVYDRHHKVLLENVMLNESKINLTDVQCQAKVSEWWEHRDHEGLVKDGKRRIHIHEYVYNSILVGVSEDDTITPYSCRLAVNGSKRLELRWLERSKFDDSLNGNKCTQTPATWKPTLTILHGQVNEH